MKSFAALKEKYKDETGHIVAKGPSILTLTAKDFGPGPVVTLNQAIHVIEPLNLSNDTYSLQQDGCRPWKGRPRPCPYECDKNYPPQKAALVLSQKLSPDCHPTYPNRYVFNPRNDLRMAWGHCSAVMAVGIVQFFGAREVKLYGFDAQAGEYRTVMGLEEMEDQSRQSTYDEVLVEVKKALKDFPHEWVQQ